MSKIYLNLDQAQLDAQYDQATLVPDLAPYSQRARAGTDAAKAASKCAEHVIYGDHQDQWLDIYSPDGDQPRPILIYIHGGAWCRQAVGQTGQAAPLYVAEGVVFAAPEFSVAPAATLDEMVRQCREAIAFMYKNAAKFGGDGERLHVFGHSSGAHLAAMTAVTDWAGDFGLPADVIKTIALASGPYDLEPVRLSARNDYLFLDADAEVRGSPARHLSPSMPPAVFAWGGGELEEFQRQSQAFADAWESAAGPVVRLEFPGNNHFDMRDEFARPGRLSDAILRQMGLGQDREK
ncbi:MAG: alpha/beta hydrolase [Rhodospirillales bacterium]|nr:alpha/beta hydrolase [Rhodospirillales bacterium]